MIIYINNFYDGALKEEIYLSGETFSQSHYLNIEIENNMLNNT